MQHRGVASAVVVAGLAVGGTAQVSVGGFTAARIEAAPPYGPGPSGVGLKPDARNEAGLRPDITRRLRLKRDSAEAARQPLPTLGPLDARGTVTYFIADATDGSAYQPSDRELAVWALTDWERASDGRLRFKAASERDALVQIHWVPASAGQYGEMRSMLVNGRRGAAVYVRPDTDALGPDIARLARQDALLRDTIIYLTCLHELGHALGLGHTAQYRDIMYFFGFGGDIPGFFNRYRTQLRTRTDIAGTSGLSPADIETVRSLYD